MCLSLIRRGLKALRFLVLLQAKYHAYIFDIIPSQADFYYANTKKQHPIKFEHVKQSYFSLHPGMPLSTLVRLMKSNADSLKSRYTFQEVDKMQKAACTLWGPTYMKQRKPMATECRLVLARQEESRG